MTSEHWTEVSVERLKKFISDHPEFEQRSFNVTDPPHVAWNLKGEHVATYISEWTDSPAECKIKTGALEPE